MGRRYDELTDKFISQVKSYFGKESDTNLTAFTSEQEYVMQLQKERLSKNNLSIKTKIEQKKNRGSRLYFGSWNDEKYKGETACNFYKWSNVFYRNNESIYKKTESEFVYGNILDTKDSSISYEEDTYNCPNCGSPSKVGELKKGCSYCGTKFEMSDLFPKVSTYYFVKDPTNNLYRDLSIIAILCAIAAVFIVSISMKDSETATGIWLVVSSIFSFIFATFFLVFNVFILYMMGYIISLIAGLGRPMRMMSAKRRGKKLFENTMKKYGPEYSYDYFSGKVASMTEMIIFSDNPDDLLICIGNPIKDMFSGIVYSTYSGAVGINNINIEGDYCTIIAEVFLNNYYYDGNHIKEKKESFFVRVSRNVNKKIDLGFSIKAIQCKNCAASFDATKNDCCPYCSTKYDIKDEDWFVTGVKKLDK
ncbi:MAG: hypothetical protein E7254_10245 [Lachnospiraceae bacterium]|nr:hypothetical protein [Lachnospiraceae bacterium]